MDLKERVMVIGLDSAPPSTTFERFLPVMPNLAELLDSSTYGPLRSTHPPITVPAWAVMATGLTPGELGMYGFRHRKPGDYQDYYLITSKNLDRPAVWDFLAGKGLRSLLVGFPPSYPPMRVRGWLISDFHTPSDAKNYTYPPWLRMEVERIAGGRFTHDVEFRVENRRPLMRELRRMTEQHLRVVERLARTKNWSLLWYVEIGMDRLHHAFWKFFDAKHPRHVDDEELAEFVEQYYRLIDEGIGRLRRAAPDAHLLIVSDHGAKAMEGAFVINEWLADNGYLEFEERPEKQTSLGKAKIRWERTKAWGWGGYYARIFVNMRGREPQGIVDPDDAEALIRQVADDLAEVTLPSGRRMGAQVYLPEELYPEVRGDAPDAIAYFGDLAWRSAGTVGHGRWFLEENDTGPDDAVHDWDGIYALYDPEGRVPAGQDAREIYDVAPTILDLFGIPHGLKGNSMVER
ncbi:MAG: alkaline phosphatase family protein [Candidatus Korarchaeota archaeon]|nr:alkaline phosphatase family protein [Candidatus Korarchaeota archaeon]